MKMGGAPCAGRSQSTICFLSSYHPLIAARRPALNFVYSQCLSDDVSVCGRSVGRADPEWPFLGAWLVGSAAWVR